MRMLLNFYRGEQYATVTFSNRKHISRIKKLYSERKDEFKINKSRNPLGL